MKIVMANPSKRKNPYNEICAQNSNQAKINVTSEPCVTRPSGNPSIHSIKNLSIQREYGEAKAYLCRFHARGHA